MKTTVPDPDCHADGLIAHAPAADRYEGQNYAADESTGLIGSLIPLHARVLDVGCGPGTVSCLLREHRHVTVVGVEPNAARAAVARARGLEVHEGYLTPELLATLGSFDAIVFADVLEHLADPAAMLHLVRPALRPGGVVVASIPNIAHWTIRLRLLAGNFNYGASGLMDATHLRWFTQRTADELFTRAGFRVMTQLGSTGQWLPDYQRVPFGLRRRLLPWLVRHQPGLFACQLIVQARPTR